MDVWDFTHDLSALSGEALWSCLDDGGRCGGGGGGAFLSDCGAAGVREAASDAAAEAPPPPPPAAPPPPLLLDAAALTAALAAPPPDALAWRCLSCGPAPAGCDRRVARARAGAWRRAWLLVRVLNAKEAALPSRLSIPNGNAPEPRAAAADAPPARLAASAAPARRRGRAQRRARRRGRAFAAAAHKRRKRATVTHAPPPLPRPAGANRRRRWRRRRTGCSWAARGSRAAKNGAAQRSAAAQRSGARSQNGRRSVPRAIHLSHLLRIAPPASHRCLTRARPRARLRAALTCTPEWRCEATLAEAALGAARAGEGALAAALGRKDASALRKRHFFWLCRHWRYASAVWARRGPGVGPGPVSGGAAAAAVRAELRAASPPQQHAQQHAQQQQQHLQRLLPLPHDAAPCALAAALRDALAAYIARTCDARLFAAAAAEPYARVTMVNPRMYRAMLPAAHAAQGAMCADAASTAAFGAMLTPAQAAECRTWCAPEVAHRAEKHLALIQQLVLANGAEIVSIRAGGATSGPDLAYAAVQTDAMDALSAFVARAQSTLATLRLGGCAAGGASVGRYVAVAALVTQLASEVMASVAARTEARAAWMLAHCAAHATPPPCAISTPSVHFLAHAGGNLMHCARTLYPGLACTLRDAISDASDGRLNM
jgi:hypothetical protein